MHNILLMKVSNCRKQLLADLLAGSLREWVVLLQILEQGHISAVFDNQAYFSECVHTFVKFNDVCVFNVLHHVYLFAYVLELGWVFVHLELFVDFDGIESLL